MNNEWQPIDSAPKDGTRVRFGSGRMVDGLWFDPPVACPYRFVATVFAPLPPPPEPAC